MTDVSNGVVCSSLVSMPTENSFFGRADNEFLRKQLLSMQQVLALQLTKLRVDVS